MTPEFEVNQSEGYGIVNPYESTATQTITNCSPQTLRSSLRWVITGCILAAVFPFTYGAYGLHREFVYAAELPPGTAACGMGSLAALTVMFVGGPFFGVIGGLVGWLGFRIMP